MSDNRRLAKNTAYLYIRMLFVMLISVYTSRIILSNLGVVDYGIYNVVGSVVALFSFLQTAMANASHRFIAHALGKNESGLLKNIFSTSLELHFLVAVIIVLLSETIGLWFFYNKLVIPQDRMTSAFVVLQISILSCFVSICQVPLNAEIIAHEKMQFYAYLSIIDVVFKLGVVFLITIIPYDKLISYASLLLVVQIIIFLIYTIYCRRSFQECRFSFIFDKGLFKEMASFASWNLFGHLSSSLSAQGCNMLLNMFFGPALNAAKGVAQQVESAVMQFMVNFLTAVTPQITKSYAADNKERVFFLLFSSTKFSFFLYIIIALPLFFELDQVLSVWLVEVPDHTSNFLRLLLIAHLTSSFFQPLNQACMATGKAGKFLAARGVTFLFVLVFTYIVFKLGFVPESMYLVQIVFLFISIYVQLSIVAPLISLSKIYYFKKTVVPLVLTLITVIPLPFIICHFYQPSLLRFLVVCAVCVISVILSFFYIGLERQERQMVVNLLHEKIPRLFNKQKNNY